MSTVTPRLGLTKPAGIEQYSLSVINNNSDAIDAFMVNTVDKMSQGVKLRSEAVGGTPSGVTDAIITNWGSFIFKANRKYEITWDVSYNFTATGTYFEFSINTCATADAATLLTGLTALNTKTKTTVGAALTESAIITAWFEPTVDTTVQVKFRAKRVAGTGTATIVASASEKMITSIKDMGAQY